MARLPERAGNLFIIIILLSWALSALAYSLSAVARRRVTVVSADSFPQPILRTFRMVHERVGRHFCLLHKERQELLSLGEHCYLLEYST